MVGGGCMGRKLSCAHKITLLGRVTAEGKREVEGKEQTAISRENIDSIKTNLSHP